MNCRYFACRKHKHYIDAGYRWAYWQLEDSGVVNLGNRIDIQSVLEVAAYWNPSEGESTAWLAEVLRAARDFLLMHKADEILYVEEEYLCEQQELGYEWKEIFPHSSG